MHYYYSQGSLLADKLLISFKFLLQYIKPLHLCESIVQYREEIQLHAVDYKQTEE